MKKLLMMMILVSFSITLYGNEMKISNGHGFQVIEDFDGQTLDFEFSMKFRNPYYYYSLHFSNSWLYQDEDEFMSQDSGNDSLGRHEDEDYREHKLTVSSFGIGIRRHLFLKKTGLNPYFGLNFMPSYVQGREWLSSSSFREENSFGFSVNSAFVLNFEGRRLTFSPGVSLGYYHGRFFDEEINSLNFKVFFNFGFKF